MSRIKAYFESMADAHKAMEQLKDGGYNRVHLDMADMFNMEFSSEVGSGDVEDAASLSAMILQSPRPVWDTDKAPIYAADPASSGMTAYAAGYAGNTVLHAGAEERDAGEIKKIIEANGGVIMNFNRNR